MPKDSPIRNFCQSIALIVRKIGVRIWKRWKKCAIAERNIARILFSFCPNDRYGRCTTFQSSSNTCGYCSQTKKRWWRQRGWQCARAWKQDNATREMLRAFCRQEMAFDIFRSTGRGSTIANPAIRTPGYTKSLYIFYERLRRTMAKFVKALRHC